MGIWKEKVLPKLQKLFGKEAAAKKAAAAAEACKSFDESKEEISKEFEEKKEEMKPKVVEIYESSTTVVKTLIKEPKRCGLKKHAETVQKFVDELVKIEFPGSKSVCEAISQHGVALVPGPITFIFEKVSILVVNEEKTREAEPPAETETAAQEKSAEPSTAPPGESKEPSVPAESGPPADPPKTEVEVQEKSAEAPAAPVAKPEKQAASAGSVEAQPPPK